MKPLKEFKKPTRLFGIPFHGEGVALWWSAKIDRTTFVRLTVWPLIAIIFFVFRINVMWAILTIEFGMQLSNGTGTEPCMNPCKGGFNIIDLLATVIGVVGTVFLLT